MSLFLTKGFRFFPFVEDIPKRVYLYKLFLLLIPIVKVHSYTQTSLHLYCKTPSGSSSKNVRR